MNNYFCTHANFRLQSWILVLLAVGMKMVAAVSKFSGVNEGCLKLAISQKKDEIEYKLQKSGCSQICQKRKVPF